MEIDSFKWSFTDFLRPNHYNIEFTGNGIVGMSITDMENLSKLCRDATFPFFTWNADQIPYNGLKRSFIQAQDTDPVVFNFSVDSNATILKFIKLLADKILDENLNYGFRDEYVMNIKIQLLDNIGLIRGEVDLFGCILANVDSIKLGADFNDAIALASIAFTYENYSYDFEKMVNSSVKAISKSNE